MASNVIKLKQLAEDELLSFFQSSLGLTTAASKNTHSYQQVFNSAVYSNNGFTCSGTAGFSSSVNFSSGFTSNSGIKVAGLISGESIKIDDFTIPTATITSLTLGSTVFTNIPIYDASQTSQAVLLPSGTVFGVKQTINAPAFEENVSGNITPGTGNGNSVVILCLSIGS